MGKRNDIQKILVIGSGPIIIGQAAEFDYAGTQACQALKQEGYEVILINSNPATIMTDREIADKIYIEPLTYDFVCGVIRKERPDGLLATLGGQTGLNLAIELDKYGILAEFEIELLGTNLDAIKKAEDRELFRKLMSELGEPVPPSEIIRSTDEAINFAEEIGYPIIIRPAYTLGGTGGGLADNEDELRTIVSSGLQNSPIKQCLIEKSIAGFKEIEYEVIRDRNNNSIIVCNMENVDPVGIHTGDSIVVAPSQTLSGKECQILRDASFRIIEALTIEGGCNIQFAFDPHSFNYYVIEVNPRVSRSSALASKATGYPIAKVASQISVGYTLDEITNPITGTTYASFEPAIDYIVTKIPCWPFNKFETANRTLGTQMKATGEVMAIARTFEESLLKALRSLDNNLLHIEQPALKNVATSVLENKLAKADDERLYAIAELFRRNVSASKIASLTQIDLFFLRKIKGIIELEEKLSQTPNDLTLLAVAKKQGFSDWAIAKYWQVNEKEVQNLRKQNKIFPVYKMVDTCAGEISSQTPYYYGTYEDENESEVSNKPSVVVLGSGPIKIGQGIEFDYATVHAVLSIREAGYEAIIINNNPETVSTDFSISDKLYFEPLAFEDVMAIIEHENPVGVVVQFGGQTALNLANDLQNAGVKILGTSLEAIDNAEDRDKFEQIMNRLSIPQPLGKCAYSVQEAIKVANEIEYPVLVRPSYVLGGRAMEIVYNEEELLRYMNSAVKVNPQHPVLIDRYLFGKEFEVDAISDGKTVYIPGIMEHIERAGVHSGDSIAVYPTQSINSSIKRRIVDQTIALAKGLKIIGLLNIQFVVHDNKVYVLEVNPRSSRTVPFLSKITQVPMANLATKAILGEKLANYGYVTGYHPEKDSIAVKVPVFSFAKLRSVDVNLGPEMKSTGEVMGRDQTIEKALYKGLIASGMKIPAHGSVLFTIADKDKTEALSLVERFYNLGFEILATSGTSKIIEENNIPVKTVNKIGSPEENILDIIRKSKAQFVVNTLTRGKQPATDGFRIRRESVENGIVCFTSLDTAEALVRVLESRSFSIKSI